MVFVDESAENRLAVDGSGVWLPWDWLWPRRMELLPAVVSSVVVVVDVLGQGGQQVTSPEDEHAVGEFGSDGADESLGVGGGLRAPRRCRATSAQVRDRPNPRQHRRRVIGPAPN